MKFRSIALLAGATALLGGCNYQGVPDPSVSQKDAQYLALVPKVETNVQFEDGVEFGAYSQVLGGVHIGDGARIGALSVVLSDVPPGSTAVGAPARIVNDPLASPTFDQSN